MKHLFTTFLRWLAGALNVSLGAHVSHSYHFECYGPDGRLKWADSLHNLVMTEGLNKYLDATLKTGLSSPAWYVGLIKAATTGVAAGDTLASHGGWTEAIPGTDYTGNRQAFTPGDIAAGSVDNSASKAVFPMLGTLTIKGAIVASAATGTSGTLLGAGNFTGGDKSVDSGDTLSVTVTASIAAS